MSSTRVLVTGVTGGGVGFGILEALKKAGYRVFATDITPYSVGLFQAEKGFMVPRANHPDYLKTMISICRENKVRVLVPGSEPELLVLSKNAALLAKKGVLLAANGRELIANCGDKWKMFLLFRKKRIPCPDSALPEDCAAFKKKHGFPFLLKQRSGSGSRNLCVVKSEEDYAFYSRRMRDLGVPFLLQEYVGSGSAEYTVGVVCRRDGSVVGSITVRRLLEGLSSQQRIASGDSLVEISTGISQGVVEDNKEIQRQCEDYAKRLGVTGPANFQGRLVNGVFNVFELNPRFSGTTPFRAGVGFNDADLVIRDLLGKKVEKPRFRSGVVVLRSLENVFIPLSEINKIRNNSGSSGKKNR